jgi:hypothetical protein
MSFVVEDGSMVVGSNSYVSVAMADAYLADSLNYSDWSAVTEDDKERLLVAASRWLDQRTKWSGFKVSADQSMRWPRTGTYDCDQLPVAVNVIPMPVIAAVCELANFFTSPDNNPTRHSDNVGFSEITVDVITLKFQDGFNPNSTRFLPGLNDILCTLGRVSTATGRGWAPIQKV